jgi:acylphosphatase
MERISVRYEGRVQGVGFRATARAIAGRHSVTGWVRNEADGAVHLEAQGPSRVVEGFLADLRSQMGQLIRSTQTAPIPLVEGETGFDIRR